METVQKYFAFLKDCHVTKTFKNSEICKVHEVSTNTITILRKLKFINKAGYGKSTWAKPEPTEKTAEQFLDAMKKYYEGEKIVPVLGQNHAIVQETTMRVTEAISVLKAKGYKIMAPKTEWVEV